MLNTNLKSATEEINKLQTLGAKQLKKTTCLENQSRRNNIQIEGIAEELGETWENTETKVKEMCVEKLQLAPPPAIERVHRIGKDKKANGTPEPRTVVCKVYDWKAEETILKTIQVCTVQEYMIFAKNVSYSYTCTINRTF